MKVLIVEDNTLARKVLVAYLEKIGYEILQAENGIEGYSKWKQHQPEIVLTDWNMPESSGIELIQSIRKSSDSHYSYIILITSREENKDLTIGFEAGADDYLIKPVNKQELYLRIRAGERLLGLQAKEQLLFAMAKLAETRDYETGKHLERIRQYAKRLALALYKEGTYSDTINELFVKSIYETSPLHDIGKVGVNDSILRKKEKLSDEEFETMKTHTLIGKNTLEEVATNGHKGFLPMAIEIAGAHHEKWDGSGYPMGLKGEEIPLSARIVTLVDVYDALRSKRVYKPAIEHKEVVETIKQGSGSHFDPLMVEVFLKIESDFEKISEEFKD